MKTTIVNLSLEQINRVKLVAFILFFVAISSQALQANTIKSSFSDNMIHRHVEKSMFELTSSFIATWEVIEIRDYVVIQVAKTGDFLYAHAIVEELRKITQEPILVDHGYENNEITYTIKVGRFSNVDEAEEYHNLFR